jgi:hypothetical protein
MAKSKRVFKQRSGGNNKKKAFTFHSYGTHYSFNPFDWITDDRIVNEVGQFESMTQLDFYKNEVLMADCDHVFILDNNGQKMKIRPGD